MRLQIYELDLFIKSFVALKKKKTLHLDVARLRRINGVTVNWLNVDFSFKAGVLNIRPADNVALARNMINFHIKKIKIKLHFSQLEKTALIMALISCDLCCCYLQIPSVAGRNLQLLARRFTTKKFTRRRHSRCYSQTAKQCHQWLRPRSHRNHASANTTVLRRVAQGASPFWVLPVVFYLFIYLELFSYKTYIFIYSIFVN